MAEPINLCDSSSSSESFDSSSDSDLDYDYRNRGSKIKSKSGSRSRSSQSQRSTTSCKRKSSSSTRTCSSEHPTETVLESSSLLESSSSSPSASASASNCTKRWTSSSTKKNNDICSSSSSMSMNQRERGHRREHEREHEHGRPQQQQPHPQQLIDLPRHEDSESSSDGDGDDAYGSHKYRNVRIPSISTLTSTSTSKGTSSSSSSSSSKKKSDTRTKAKTTSIMPSSSSMSTSSTETKDMNMNVDEDMNVDMDMDMDMNMNVDLEPHARSSMTNGDTNTPTKAGGDEKRRRRQPQQQRQQQRNTRRGEHEKEKDGMVDMHKNLEQQQQQQQQQKRPEQSIIELSDSDQDDNKDGDERNEDPFDKDHDDDDVVENDWNGHEHENQRENEHQRGHENGRERERERENGQQGEQHGSDLEEESTSESVMDLDQWISEQRSRNDKREREREHVPQTHQLSKGEDDNVSVGIAIADSQGLRRGPPIHMPEEPQSPSLSSSPSPSSSSSPSASPSRQMDTNHHKNTGSKEDVILLSSDDDDDDDDGNDDDIHGNGREHEHGTCHDKPYSSSKSAAVSASASASIQMSIDIDDSDDNDSDSDLSVLTSPALFRRKANAKANGKAKENANANATSQSKGNKKRKITSQSQLQSQSRSESQSQLRQVSDSSNSTTSWKERQGRQAGQGRLKDDRAYEYDHDYDQEDEYDFENGHHHDITGANASSDDDDVLLSPSLSTRPGPNRGNGHPHARGNGLMRKRKMSHDQRSKRSLSSARTSSNNSSDITGRGELSPLPPRTPTTREDGDQRRGRGQGREEQSQSQLLQTTSPSVSFSGIDLMSPVASIGRPSVAVGSAQSASTHNSRSRKVKVKTPPIPVVNVNQIGGRLYPDLRHHFIQALIKHAKRTRHALHQKCALDGSIRAINKLALYPFPIRTPEAAGSIRGVGKELLTVLNDAQKALKEKKKNPYNPPIHRFSSAAAAALVALLDYENEKNQQGALCPMENLISGVNLKGHGSSRTVLFDKDISHYLDKNTLDPGWMQIRKLCGTGEDGNYVKERRRKGACTSGIVFELLEDGRREALALKQRAALGVPPPGPFRQLASDTVYEEFGNVTISMDFREGGGGKNKLHEMCNFFDEHQIPYVVRNLKISDYVFFVGNKLAPVLIERKSIEDVACSLHDGRWERQQRSMRKAQYVLGGGDERKCYLCYLIEGDIDRTIVHGGYVGRRSYGKTIQDVKDAIASLPELGFSVIQSKNKLGSLHKIKRVAQEFLWLANNGSIDCTYTYDDFVAAEKRLRNEEGDPPQDERHKNPAPPIVDANSSDRAGPLFAVENQAANNEDIPANANSDESTLEASLETQQRREELLKLPMKDLKEQCKERGDKMTGKKSDLVARLLQKRRPEILITRARRNQYVPKVPSCNAAILVALLLHHDPNTPPLSKERIMLLAEETGISKDPMFGNGKSWYDGWSGMKDMTGGDPPLISVVKRKYALTTQPIGSAGVDVARAIHVMAHRQNLCTCGNFVDPG